MIELHTILAGKNLPDTPPKYLNSISIPASPGPLLHVSSITTPKPTQFHIKLRDHDTDLDSGHRLGLPGFVFLSQHATPL
jgi:hypothetical protein